MKKNILFLIAAVIAAIFYTIPVFGNERQEYIRQIEQINIQIQNLKEQEKGLLEQISLKNKDILDLNIRIEQGKKAIEHKEQRIQKTEEKLQQAEQDKEEQYQGIKKRIQFFYQNGNQNALSFYFDEQADFLEFLNRIELMGQLYQTDRIMLNNFAQTIRSINDSKEKLLQEKKELELSKIGLEENVIKLENQILELGEREIWTKDEIKRECQSEAALANKVAEIDFQIASMEAQKEQILYNYAVLGVVPEQQNIATPAAISLPSQQVTPISTTSSIDSDIISYANQFVGNPYSWGGNSLTDGVDCSHFVWNVLKDTGHYSGGYAVADDWAYLGQSVSSLDQAQAGDVVVYSGHVAIYDGQGGIIEAQSSQAGITNDRSADANTITAIRHFE